MVEMYFLGVYLVEKKKSGKLNLLYGLLQGGYWMQYCAALSFASVVMLDRGYTNAEIGVVLALGNAFAVLFQTEVAKFADKSKKVSLAAITTACYILEAVVFGIILMQDKAGILFSVAIVILSVLAASTQGFVNALCYRMETETVKINFGAARAVGSLGFAVVSIIIGNLVEKNGANIAPIFGFFTCAYLIIVLLVISLNSDTKSRITEEQAKEKESIFSFIGRYKLFFVFLIGVLMFYMSHSFINNFYIQIIENVGGNEKDLGGMLSFAAITELLPMFLYSKLEKKFGARKIIFVGAVCFFIKVLLTFIAWNVFMVYVATFFQMLSFALFIPASVSFVNQIMDEKDAVRGQAMLMVSVSLAFLIASLTGGLIDGPGVKAVLLGYSVIALAGAILTGFTLKKFAKNSRS